MSSARSSFLRRGCCFPESHPALLFPPMFPFSLLSMKPAGHPPAPSLRRLRRSPLCTFRGWRDAHSDGTPVGGPALWEERRVELAPDGPPRGPRTPGGPSVGAPALEFRPPETSPVSSPRGVRDTAASCPSALLRTTGVLVDKPWWQNRAQLLPAAGRWGGVGGSGSRSAV